MCENEKSDSLLNFVKSCLSDDEPTQGISSDKVFGYIARFDEDNPYWVLFMVCEDSKGHMLFGGEYGLQDRNMSEFLDVLTLFSKQNRRLIIDTQKYFSSHAKVKDILKQLKSIRYEKSL